MVTVVFTVMRKISLHNCGVVQYYEVYIL